MNKNEIEDKILAYYEGEAPIESIQDLLDINSYAKEVYDDYRLLYDDLDNIVEAEISEFGQANFKTWLNNQSSDQIGVEAKVLPFNYKKFLSIAAVGLAVLASIQFLMNNNAKQDKIAMDQEIRQLMVDKSSSERIKAINISTKSDEQSDETNIIALLIFTLENDKSSNVRLAAVEALADFVKNDEARSALITSLAKEIDGAVKVAAINALSNFNNSEIKETLKKVTQDKSNDKFVIDEAHIKLLSLDQH